LISLSWDAFITLTFIIATVYGFVLQKDRLTVVLVSTYVALAVANVWAEGVYQILLGKSNLLGSWTTNLSLFTVSAGLFILFIILLTLRGGLSAEEDRASGYMPFIMAFLGFLTAGLILSSIFSLMPEGTREGLIASSRMASFIWKYHIWWIVLPPLVLVFSSMLRKPPRV
jgi:hypothetical protein